MCIYRSCGFNTSSFFTGLPQCSAPSPARPGISRLGLPRLHSASFTKKSCSSSASFCSCSLCRKPVAVSSSFSSEKMVRSFPLISSTCRTFTLHYPRRQGLAFQLVQIVPNHIYTAKNITISIVQDCKKHYSKTWQFINVHFHLYDEKL